MGLPTSLLHLVLVARVHRSVRLELTTDFVFLLLVFSEAVRFELAPGPIHLILISRILDERTRSGARAGTLSLRWCEAQVIVVLVVIVDAIVDYDGSLRGWRWGTDGSAMAG